MVISVRPEQVKFFGTPTIAVLGPNGRVRGLWVGKLRDGAAEDEVISMASRLDKSEISATPDSAVHVPFSTRLGNPTSDREVR